MSDYKVGEFQLHRSEDVSGVSGTGIVADGIVFDDWTTVVRWRGDTRSTVIWDSPSDMMAIHGHGGKTEMVYHTDETIQDLLLAMRTLENENKVQKAIIDGLKREAGDARPEIQMDHTYINKMTGQLVIVTATNKAHTTVKGKFTGSHYVYPTRSFLIYHDPA